jgi:hypothetical protein
VGCLVFRLRKLTLWPARSASQPLARMLPQPKKGVNPVGCLVFRLRKLTLWPARSASQPLARMLPQPKKGVNPVGCLVFRLRKRPCGRLALLRNRSLGRVSVDRRQGSAEGELDQGVARLAGEPPITEAHHIDAREAMDQPVALAANAAQLGVQIRPARLGGGRLATRHRRRILGVLLFHDPPVNASRGQYTPASAGRNQYVRSPAARALPTAAAAPLRAWRPPGAAMATSHRFWDLWS